MKKIIFALIIFIMFFIPQKAYATDYKQQIYEITQEYGADPDKINSVTLNDVLDYILSVAEEKIEEPFELVIKISGIILICAIVHALRPQKDNAMITVCDTLCCLITYITLLLPVKNIIGTVSGNILRIKNFMTAFLPVFSSITFLSGEVATSVIYSGLFLSGIIFITGLCSDLILPSINFFTAVRIADSMSPYIKLKSIGEFYLKAIKWTMKTIVSMLCFILTIQTTIAQGSDTFAVKTGKVLVGSAIPIVGSALQDAVGSIYAGMEVIKGFAGAAGTVTIAGIFVPSIISILVYWVSFNILNIISELFDTEVLAGCIKTFTDITELLISIIALIMVLLIFSLTIIISLTNGV